MRTKQEIYDRIRNYHELSRGVSTSVAVEIKGWINELEWVLTTAKKKRMKHERQRNNEEP